jgi:hypothetical protein
MPVQFRHLRIIAAELRKQTSKQGYSHGKFVVEEELEVGL